MIIDARQLPSDHIIECDVCIVGAGAAGITLAHELRDAGMEVVLLESGGVRLEADTQDLDKGDVVGPNCHPPLHQFRQRRLGGTTNVWSGGCVPFDAVDFETRSHVPYSGWPISKSDLDPYYARAHVYCELGEYAYDVTDALADQPKSMIPDLHSEELALDHLRRFSPPTNFRKAYVAALKKSSNIKIYLHANCLKIVTNQAGTIVNHLKVACLDGNEFLVQARHYVLAAGCLEVTRLLLLSDHVQPGGLGNAYGMVGRFYMSHIHGKVAEVQITPRNGAAIWDYERTAEGVYCRRMIRINEEKQLERKLLNFSAILSAPALDNPQHKNGVLSTKYLANLLISRIAPATNATVIDLLDQAGPRYLPNHLRNVILDFPHLLRFSGTWVSRNILSNRKFLSVGLKDKSNVYTLEIDAEQAPNPYSRVALSHKKDRFGHRRLKVDWQITDLDVQSVLASCQLIEQALSRSGVGRMRMAPDLMSSSTLNKPMGGHHIGTTRMAREPSLGVVDENCRVHGVNNLHIASSSVFPTSGYANPTLTIIALAIRLADRLKLSHEYR